MSKRICIDDSDAIIRPECVSVTNSDGTVLSAQEMKKRKEIVAKSLKSGKLPPKPKK